MERMRDAAHTLNQGKPLGRALRDEVIVAFLFDTGLRNDECRAVQPDGMIRLDNGELYLPGHVQKDYPHDCYGTTSPPIGIKTRTRTTSFPHVKAIKSARTVSYESFSA
jgi:hypothetical protein